MIGLWTSTLAINFLSQENRKKCFIWILKSCAIILFSCIIHVCWIEYSSDTVLVYCRRNMMMWISHKSRERAKKEPAQKCMRYGQISFWFFSSQNVLTVILCINFSHLQLLQNHWTDRKQYKWSFGEFKFVEIKAFWSKEK